MNDWQSDSLGDLVTFQKGKKVATSPFLIKNYERYLGAGSLVDGHDGYALTFLSVLANKKDVLMLWDGERSGLVGHNLKGVVSSTVSKLTPNNKIISNFLYYYLLYKFEWIQNRRTGTGVPHVPKDLSRILVLNYPEEIIVQQKISLILETIDKNIKNTEALIEKYQQIKTGLMHDLFTCGITADGKLRPTKEQAPELYKETPIGWIPNDWNCDELANLLAPIANNLRSGPFGSALLKSELVQDGIPFLGIDNIHIEKFVDTYRRFVSEKKFNELIKYSVRPKDVVITIMGTVGRCSVLPENIGQALSSKHLWTMTLNQELVIPELVCWQLNYASWVKAWFRKETQGGIMDAIQSKTLKTLCLPLPPIPEQERIFEKYKAVTLKIRTETNKLEKLCKEKSGLMHDLLTGKVQVNIDENEVVNVG